MEKKKYDVYGIANALVDFSVKVDDALLKEFNLTKGRFHQIDEVQSKAILERIRYVEAKISAGGSAANAIATIAMLGGKAAHFSKIGDDEYGASYEKETQEAGVDSKLKKSPYITGHCIVLMTPDAERTFVVNYGASIMITPEEISEEDIKASKILHIDSYEIDSPELKPICIHAFEYAKKHKTKVSLDLSDPGVVQRNKEELKNIIKTYVDIVFANEEEAFQLTGKDAEAACDEIAQWCGTAIVKLGAQGSIIKTKDKKVRINAVKTIVVDTTGAGDAYAAGFLYGITHDLSLEESGNLASLLGAKVVSQIGARLTPEMIKKILEK